SLIVLAIIIYLGPKAGSIHWAIFIVSSIFLSLTQPAVGMAFSLSNAGKALTSFNLLIFIGAFFMQWIIGLIIDAGMSLNFSEIISFKLAILTLMNTVNSSAYGLRDFNFIDLHFITKHFLIFFMIIGRVELLSLLLIAKKFLFKY
ncbi:hypothetical protein OAM84_03535, partial [Candidatus Pelagibacter sp.]|nr:hypothetical protein [Candidatus Pelagibacter sp.]